MVEKILKVEHLKKSYDGKTNVLDDISFGIEKRRGCGYSRPVRLWKKYFLKVFE